MSNKKFKERMDWNKGDLNIKVLQCHDCIHRNNLDGCGVFGKIPEGIWNFKVDCDYYNSEE